MNRWFEFHINVSLRKSRGVFGFERTRHEFKFCATSRDEAVALALSNVPSRGWPYDNREFQVVSSIPIDGPMISDECRNGGCEDCNYLWCKCSKCHSAVAFRLEHPTIRSLAECESEREESEAA